MKTLEIKKVGTTRFKLTVTPTRVTVKVPDDQPEETVERVMAFFETVYQHPLMETVTKSYRGRLDTIFALKNLQLKMMNDSKNPTETLRFYESH